MLKLAFDLDETLAWAHGEKFNIILCLCSLFGDAVITSRDALTVKPMKRGSRRLPTATGRGQGNVDVALQSFKPDLAHGALGTGCLTPPLSARRDSPSSNSSTI